MAATCDELLARLNLPEGADIFTLCERLGRERGRPVFLVPVELRNPKLFGIWFATDGADFIAYEKCTSALHQEHIIAHELAHIVSGHRGIGGGLDDAGVEQLFPSLDPRVVRAMLQRSGYSDSDEHEAETLASLLLARLRRPPAEHVWQVPPTEAETVARIESVVGLPRTGREVGAHQADSEPESDSDSESNSTSDSDSVSESESGVGYEFHRASPSESPPEPEVP
ncbi:hypothetical protein [Streptomyces sp. KR80]|uniref:hypothetical protein n=1 Tax=Streptomyces sp. KR80 TaxID=3457426 RepID=UPI003FD06285